ncbi:MAG TPA: 5-oxoprolinase subunit PxpA [Trueperaceae bacterium]
MTIDLNADMGEAFGRWSVGEDEALLSVVSSANVACGFHAGDPSVMRRTVRLCRTHGVAVGAHPGYPDLRGFGRTELMLQTQQIEDDVLYQLGALAAVCRAEGVRLAYLKPHGALSSRIGRDPAAADAVVRAVQSFDPGLPLLALAGSLAEQSARAAGVPCVREAYIDRAYLPDGRLQSRSEPGSVLEDPERAAVRALQLAQEGTVRAVDGTLLRLAPASLCLHGDTPGALALARAVRRQLEGAGVRVRAFVEGG